MLKAASVSVSSAAADGEKISLSSAVRLVIWMQQMCTSRGLNINIVVTVFSLEGEGESET